MEIELDSHWVVRGSTNVRGHAHVDGRFCDAAALAVMFDACESFEDFLSHLTQLNGSYAVVKRHAKGLWASVDQVRSVPLFYGLCGRELVLSDRAEQVRLRLGESEQCPVASEEFRVTGYVTGPDTLFPNVKQVQAGEILLFSADESGQLSRFRHYQWRHRDPSAESSETLMARLHRVHTRVARRLIEGLNGRQVVLPLSGGYDSRLLAVMLKEHHYDNVLCYTYGLPGNWEANISESLARHLGLRWEFVPYSGARWRAWGVSTAFKRYCQFASNGASIPHVQDWPAILELRKTKAIADDAVVVPGHSGDFLAGSHIPRWFEKKGQISRHELLQALLDAHYSLWDWRDSGADLREQFVRRIDAVSEPIRGGSSSEAADQLECWDMNERQSKFICNSVRVYDYFGLSWRLPLFDRELLDFWERVPLALRVGRRLYFDYVDRYQSLPVPVPNRDRGAVFAGLVNLANKTGMRDWAKAIQFESRRRHWRSTYENCKQPPLGWFTLIDRELFKRTYTGKQTLHAYLAYLGARGAFRQDLFAPEAA